MRPTRRLWRVLSCTFTTEGLFFRLPSTHYITVSSMPTPGCARYVAEKWGEEGGEGGQAIVDFLVRHGIINWGLTNKFDPPGPCCMISGIAGVTAAAAATAAATIVLVVPRLTVGGGDGLPSESSTLASVRSSSCCNRNARSSLARWIPRRDRCIRKTSTSLDSSISLIRFLISMHFWRYEFSTEIGRAAWPSGDLAIRW